jgi:hypothetical protein
MSLTLNQFKKYLELTEPLLYNGIKKYLVVENKIVLKSISKLMAKSYSFKELNRHMRNLLNKEIREELLRIHNNGTMYSCGGYYSNILVGDINYKLPVKFDDAVTTPVELDLLCVCPYEDAFAMIYYDESGVIQITPGFSLEKRNIRTDNGNDWIRYYIGRNDIGHVYKIKCERDCTIFYKVGISKHIDARIKSLSENFKIHSIETFENPMIVNAIIERAFHTKYITKKLHFKDKFDGSNECYVLDLPILSIRESLMVLQSSNYSINDKLLKLILNEQLQLEEEI